MVILYDFRIVEKNPRGFQDFVVGEQLGWGRYKFRLNRRIVGAGGMVGAYKSPNHAYVAPPEGVLVLPLQVRHAFRKKKKHSL